MSEEKEWPGSAEEAGPTYDELEARVRALERALAKLGRAHAEVCPSKNECAVLIEARAMLAP